jgi:hypothetical protein
MTYPSEEYPMDLPFAGGPLAANSDPQASPDARPPMPSAIGDPVAQPGWSTGPGQPVWPPANAVQQSWVPPDAAQAGWPPVITEPGWPPAAMPPGWSQPIQPGPTWAPVSPAVAPTSVRRSGRTRAVDMLFSLSILVAVSGVAFAVGRSTAPASPAALGAGSFAGRPGLGATGTSDTTGTNGAAQGGPRGQNAMVIPAASGAPDVPDQQQPTASAAPSSDAGTDSGSSDAPGAGGVDPAARPGGFGRGGGLTGVVEAIGDGTITFTTPTGQAAEVTITDATTWHQQQVATAADVAVGSLVRISVDPAALTTGTAALTATDVQVLLPTEGTGVSAASQAAAPQDPGRGGFARGGLTGTVSAIGAGTLAITTADGQTTQLATTDATTYQRQEVATPADVTVGSSIRVTAAGGFGGGRPGQGGPVGSAPPGTVAGTPAITASDVELLLPAG